MRRKYLLKSLFLLAACVASSYPQPDSKVVLLDEFGMIPCGDLLSRLDALVADLGSSPASTAVIVIEPPSHRPHAANVRRTFVSSRLQQADIPVSRYRIYRGKPGEQIRTKIWKLAPRGEAPIGDAVLWEDEPLDLSRAFMFGYEDENGVCPTFVPQAFAKLILNNPGSKGHIVVAAATEGASLNKYYFASESIKELVEKHGVPRNRLRLFFTKQQPRYLTAAEFWFVPARKKSK